MGEEERRLASAAAVGQPDKEDVRLKELAIKKVPGEVAPLGR